MNAQDLSFEEAYAFNEGDEFVYEILDYKNPWNNFVNYHLYQKIIAKYWSDNRDTLFYEIRSQRRAHVYNGDFIKNIYSKIDTSERFYTQLKRKVVSVRPDTSDFPQYGPYNTIKDTTFNGHSDVFCQKNSTGFSRRFVSGRAFTFTRKWVKNLGLIQETHDHGSDSLENFERRLIYFKNQHEECGSLSEHQLSDLSIREVFDFDIGDRFIYENENYNGAPLDACLKEVIDKKLDETNAQLIYTYIKTGYKIEWESTPSPYRIYHFIEKDTVRESYYHINDPVWNMWPAISSMQNIEDLDTIKTYESDQCTPQSHAFEYRNYLSSGQNLTISGKFMRGRGQVNSFIYNQDNQDTLEIWNQIYANTRSIECGSKDLILLSNKGGRQSDLSELVTLFPNPVENTLHLKTDLPGRHKVRLEFIDSYGNLIKETESNSTGIYDISQLENGFYLVAIRFDEQVIFKKIQVN